MKMKKTFLFRIYQWVVVLLTAIALLSFVVYYVAEQFPNMSVENRPWLSSLHSVVRLIGRILALCCTGHVLILVWKHLCSKPKHSFVWHVKQELVPLVFPIVAYLIISAYSGTLEFGFSDLFCGILGGIISSIIVLIMDRKHTLAEAFIKAVAPEFQETGSKATLMKNDEELL